MKRNFQFDLFNLNTSQVEFDADHLVIKNSKGLQFEEDVNKAILKEIEDFYFIEDLMKEDF